MLRRAFAAPGCSPAARFAIRHAEDLFGEELPRRLRPQLRSGAFAADIDFAWRMYWAARRGEQAEFEARIAPPATLAGTPGCADRKPAVATRGSSTEPEVRRRVREADSVSNRALGEAFAAKLDLLGEDGTALRRRLLIEGTAHDARLIDGLGYDGENMPAVTAALTRAMAGPLSPDSPAYYAVDKILRMPAPRADELLRSVADGPHELLAGQARWVIEQRTRRARRTERP